MQAVCTSNKDEGYLKQSINEWQESPAVYGAVSFISHSEWKAAFCVFQAVGNFCDVVNKSSQRKLSQSYCMVHFRYDFRQKYI